jgi:hypothetical protein
MRWFVILKQVQDDEMRDIYRKNLCGLCGPLRLCAKQKNGFVSRKGAKIFERAVPW